MEWTDDQVDQIMGTLLRVGVILSAAVVLAGGIWHLVQSGGTIPDYRTFRGEPAELRSITGILRAPFQSGPPGLIQLGLLILIATPVARVVFSVVTFALRRDRMYVWITLAVLAVLLSSLFGLTAAR
jgi:uncharacterized membrane protein